MTEAEALKKIRAYVRLATAAAKKADTAAEVAAMRTYDAFHILKFGKAALSPQGQRALERLDKAHDQLGGARHELGNAHYQLEQVLNPNARDRVRLRRKKRS